MKMKHAITIFIVLFIGLVILGQGYLPIGFEIQEMLIDIVGILSLVSLGLIAYLIIRNIFRAIKGAITEVPQGEDYRREARRACEKATPKKNEDITPPREG